MFHQDMQNTEKCVEKTRRSRVFFCFCFFTDFTVFGYPMKSSFECLILLLKSLIILGEIQGKSSSNLW